MTTRHRHARQTVTPDFQEVENAIQRAVDYFIDPEAKDDTEARAIMREWVLAHVDRDALDLGDF